MSEFKFEEMTNDQIWGYMREGYIFNVAKTVLRKIQVIENVINSEYGSSGQFVNIYIPEKRADGMRVDWIPVEKYVNLSDCFSEDTESGSGVYDLSLIINTLDQNHVDYSGILIITRTKSEFLFDGENKDKVFSEYYNICDEQCGLFLENHSNISGWLARKGFIVFSMDDLRSVIEQEDTQKDSLSEYLKMKYLEEIDGFYN